MIAGRVIAFSIRGCIALGLLFCGYKALRQGVAAWYFRQGTPEAVESAIRWDPGNPQYFDTWGTLLRLYANNAEVKQVIAAYQQATRLAPANASYWADLGEAYEWAGEREPAAQAFQCAVRLAPNSPEIHWRLANFEIRSGHTDLGLRALQKALPAEGLPRQQIFAMATRATRDTRAILNLAVPPRAGVLFDFLGFLLAQGNLEAAHEVWNRILELNLSFELRQAFPYLDALLGGHEPQRAAAVWALLAARYPAQIPDPPRGGQRISNGRLAGEILNGGLDWRVVPVDGARVIQEPPGDKEGARGLRIEFDGTQNLNYAQVSQYVVVEPGMRYRFSAAVRTAGITTDSGPRFRITDAYDAQGLSLTTAGETGSSEAHSVPLDFRTGPRTRLLLVQVIRTPSGKFANRIAGTLWITQVSLEEVP